MFCLQLASHATKSFAVATIPYGYHIQLYTLYTCLRLDHNICLAIPAHLHSYKINKKLKI